MRNSVARPDGPQKRSHANEFEFFGIYVATSAARRNHASSLGRSLRFAQQNSAYCYKILVTYSGEDPEMRSASFRMWRRFAAALTLYASLGVGSAVANSTEDAVMRANRIAYDATIKCAVANAVASDDRHDAGDEAGASDYQAKSRRSFDLTYQLGGKLGLGETQIAHDLDFAQLSELPKMMRDRKYFLSTVATCKALHLM